MSSISFKPIMCNSTELSELDIVNGRLLMVSDTQKMYIDTDNTRIQVSDGIGEIPIGSATNLIVISGDEEATVKWKDPMNLATSTTTYSTWSGTKMVIKEGSYPISPEDGILITDSKVKDQYTLTGYSMTGLTNETIYYGKLFPYSTNGYINVADNNKFILNPNYIYPSAATIRSIIEDRADLTLTVRFTMPEDAIKATVVMKAGSEPMSSTDGIAITDLVSSQIAEFSNIERDVTYHFKVFTYNAKNRETASIEKTAIIESTKIVSFSEGTDYEIMDMIDAHYTGEIDIADYWSVGDTRKIHLKALTFTDGSTSSITREWPAQDITIVITAIKYHDLANPIYGKTKAAITCQTKEVINNNSSASGNNGHITFHLSNQYFSEPTSLHWSTINLKSFANGEFYNTMLPALYRLMIVPIKHNVLATRGCSGSGSNGTVDKTIETITEKIFIPTYTEVFGNTSYTYYLSGNTPNNEEGTRWPYYNTASNRIKYGNNNGESNGTAQYWWIGSPTTRYSSTYKYYWGAINSSGASYCYYGTGAYGFAPAFCL